MTNRRKQISDYLFNQRDSLTQELQAMTHPDRFAIVALLFYDQQPFHYLREQLSISKTALANHLQYLQHMSVIRKVERGWYAITEDTRMLLQSLADYQVERYKREYQQMRTRYLQSFDQLEVRVMTVDTNIVHNNVEFQATWITYAGAVAGILQAFGESYDVIDILRYSGYAFLSNVSRRSSHIAGPTATPFFELFDQGVSSLGFPLRGFWDEGAIFGNQGLDQTQISRLNKLFEFVKKQLDHNNPVILWGLGAAEFGIVTGYEGEYYQVSTFRQFVPGIDDDKVHYTNLESPGGLMGYYFERKETEPSEQTDRSAIERALIITRGNSGTTTVGTPKETWVEEEMDYIAGPRAFGIWAGNIEKGEIEQTGNAYVLACYQEGRAAAAEFFSRLVYRYQERPFVNQLQQLVQTYEVISGKLKDMVVLFPFPRGNTNADALSTLSGTLREVMTLEDNVLELLESCLQSWKTEQ